GARFGQLVAPAELRRLVRDLGRVPAQRNTVYDLVRVYADPAADEVSPLDAVDNADERFGSYRRLATGGEFRFTRRYPGDAGCGINFRRCRMRPVCRVN